MHAYNIYVSKIEVTMDVRNPKSGDMKRSGETGLNIRTHAHPKMGQGPDTGDLLDMPHPLQMFYWNLIEFGKNNTT